MGEVTVIELAIGNLGLWVVNKNAPSRILVGIPMNYIWVRMRREDGVFFLLEWENSGEENLFYRIPKGTMLGNHKVEKSHNYTIYNENRTVIGSFEDISRDASHNLVLVRIFPPPY